MARVNPKLLYADSNRIKVIVTKKIAVGIMIGMITESDIISSATMGFKNPYNVHRVTIAPAQQEFRRDMSVWGKLLGFTTITGPTSKNGISFSTFGEGKGLNFASA